jgi:hypothetical protein
MRDNKSTNSSWMDITNESVHTSDDKDIGDVEAINRNFIVVKRGFVNMHYYYIPISNVEGWDGHVVWLKITEDEVRRGCQKDIVPDQATYYTKNYPYEKMTPYTEAYFPKMPIIERRYSKKPYTRSKTSVSSGTENL